MIIVNPSSANTNWMELLAIVQEDIKVIESTPQRDFTIWLRLFELYSEKHSLLVHATNELKINKDSDPRFNKSYNKLKKIETNTLEVLKKFSRKLVKKVKDPRILLKIYYFEALNHYITGEEVSFFKKLKKAERSMKKIKGNKGKYKRNIYVRIADFHFNKGKYKKAIKYYKKLMKMKKNRWLTKYLYNLSWCYFKLENYKLALKTIKSSFKYSLEPEYIDYKIRNIESILLFYPKTNNIQKGLSFLEKNSLLNFENLQIFFKNTFEFGKKRNSIPILEKMEKVARDDYEWIKLLRNQLQVFRSLKKYNQLQKKINIFNKQKINFKKVEEGEKELLISDLQGYTGLLQSLIKNFPDKRKSIYTNYVSTNFNLLKRVNPSDSLQYDYFRGETYFSIGKYNTAIIIYKKIIKTFLKKTKKNLRNSSKIVKQTFDSYFKSLEYLKSSKSFKKSILESYLLYIKTYPKSNKTPSIYRKLINLYFDNKNYKAAVNTTIKYNKRFPKEIAIQQNFIKKLTNIYISDGELKSLIGLKRTMKKLKFKKSDYQEINKIITQFKYNNAIKNINSDNPELKSAALSSLNKLYEDKTVPSKTKLNVGLTLLKYFYDSNQMNQLFNKLKAFMRNTSKRDQIANFDKFEFYFLTFCKRNFIAKCIYGLEHIKENFPKNFSRSQKDQLFYIYLAHEKFKKALSIMGKERDKKEYFKQVLLTMPFEKVFKVMKSNSQIKQMIISEMEEISWILSIDKILKINDSPLSNFKNYQYVSNKVTTNEKRYLKLRTKLPILRVYPPKPLSEKKYISFEEFAKFLEDFFQELQAIDKIYNQIIKDSDPQFSLPVTNYFIRIYQNRLITIQKYNPLTNDQDLKKAILEQISKIIPVLNQKINQYTEIKNKYSLSGSDFSGSGFFNIKNKIPYVGNDFLWAN